MAGGGADYRINPRFSGPLEGDWVCTGFFNHSQNNFPGSWGEWYSTSKELGSFAVNKSRDWNGGPLARQVYRREAGSHRRRSLSSPSD